MKKIKLALDSLTVESFDTGHSAGEPGTVHAHVMPSNLRCDSEWSCRDTCHFLSCLETQCYCDVKTFQHTCDDVVTCAFYGC